MARAHSKKTTSMHVTIRLAGGYIFVHPDYQADGSGYAFAAIVGGVWLTERRWFNTTEPHDEPPIVETRLSAGIISVHVQKEGEGEYEYLPSSNVVPVTLNHEASDDIGPWLDVRNVYLELADHAKKKKQKYAAPPIQFTGFSVFAFFNHGVFSTDKKRRIAASNMTTRQVVVHPTVRIDFDVLPEEELCVMVATPRLDGNEIVMREEEWLELKGLGLIRLVEIGIEPLNAYAALPILGYEGLQNPPNDKGLPGGGD